MPQLANLVLTDRKATPVAHTFTPRSIDNGVGVVAESTGIPVGDPRVSISLGKVTASGRYKPTVRFTFPVVQTQTINGISTPVVVRTAYIEINCNFDQTSSEAERNDCMGMVQDSLRVNATLIHDTLVKLQGVY